MCHWTTKHAWDESFTVEVGTDEIIQGMQNYHYSGHTHEEARFHICKLKIYFTYKVIILSGPIFQIDFKLYVSFVYMKSNNLAKKKVGRAV